MSAIISSRNYRDVLALVIKQYFISEMSVEDIFDTACDIARAGAQDEALERLEWLRTHALETRLD